jgi:PHD/YefM family antitoxin component YafN of YafNO toxin-antitoxin module
MKTLEMEKASKSLADYAADLGSESLVITSNKKPVAALASLKNTDHESVALSLSPAFAKIIRRARAEAKRGKIYSLKQVKEELLSEAEAPNTALHPTPVRVLSHSARVPSASKKTLASARVNECT